MELARANTEQRNSNYILLLHYIEHLLQSTRAVRCTEKWLTPDEEVRKNIWPLLHVNHVFIVWCTLFLPSLLHACRTASIAGMSCDQLEMYSNTMYEKT